MGLLIRGCHLDIIFQAHVECGFGYAGCQDSGCPLKKGTPGYPGQPTTSPEFYAEQPSPWGRGLPWNSPVSSLPRTSVASALPCTAQTPSLTAEFAMLENSDLEFKAESTPCQG